MCLGQDGFRGQSSAEAVFYLTVFGFLVRGVSGHLHVDRPGTAMPSNGLFYLW